MSEKLPEWLWLSSPFSASAQASVPFRLRPGSARRWLVRLLIGLLRPALRQRSGLAHGPADRDVIVGASHEDAFPPDGAPTHRTHGRIFLLPLRGAVVAHHVLARPITDLHGARDAEMTRYADESAVLYRIPQHRWTDVGLGRRQLVAHPIYPHRHPSPQPRRITHHRPDEVGDPVVEFHEYARTGMG